MCQLKQKILNIIYLQYKDLPKEIFSQILLFKTLVCVFKPDFFKLKIFSYNKSNYCYVCICTLCKFTHPSLLFQHPSDLLILRFRAERESPSNFAANP